MVGVRLRRRPFVSLHRSPSVVCFSIILLMTLDSSIYTLQEQVPRTHSCLQACPPFHKRRRVVQQVIKIQSLPVLWCVALTDAFICPEHHGPRQPPACVNACFYIIFVLISSASCVEPHTKARQLWLLGSTKVAFVWSADVGSPDVWSPDMYYRSCALLCMSRSRSSHQKV